MDKATAFLGVGYSCSGLFVMLDGEIAAITKRLAFFLPNVWTAFADVDILERGSEERRSVFFVQSI